LHFRTGERIIVEKEDGPEWLYGSIGATRRGWFPSDLVKVEEHHL